MSAADLRKALESDEVLNSYRSFTLNEAFRVDILALIDEEVNKKAAIVVNVTSDKNTDRIDGYIQAALTGFSANSTTQLDITNPVHVNEFLRIVSVIAKAAMAEADKSMGESICVKGGHVYFLITVHRFIHCN